MTLDQLTRKLISLLVSGHGEKCVYICLPDVPFLPVSEALLELDQDGGVVLLKSEERK